MPISRRKPQTILLYIQHVRRGHVATDAAGQRYRQYIVTFSDGTVGLAVDREQQRLIDLAHARRAPVFAKFDRPDTIAA